LEKEVIQMVVNRGLGGYGFHQTEIFAVVDVDGDVFGV
jgi:hypothetical protein